MKTGFFQSVRRVLGLTLGTFAALALSMDVAQAAKANCSITTVPTPANISVGGSVDFSGSVSGKSPYTYEWTFVGGAPASSSSQNVTVSYAIADSWTATLSGTNDKGGACTASTTVTVSPAGGNQSPTANANGPYNGTVGTAVTFDSTGSIDPDGTITAYEWNFGDGNTGTGASPSHTYTSNAVYDVTLTVTDNDSATGSDSTTANIIVGGGSNTPPTLSLISDKLVVEGRDLTFPVLATDDGLPSGTLTLSANDLPGNATFTDNGDGSGYFEWLNVPLTADTDTTFTADDGSLQDAEQITITVQPYLPPPDISLDIPQTDFKIMMNYELGMHCTGFEFAYCCVLPVYNSILAQVVKPNQGTPVHGGDFPMLLEGDPNVGLDGLGRQTVVRDRALDPDNNDSFKKYVLRYWHDAQPRNDGRGKQQTSTLISAVEGNSMMSWNTTFDSAAVDPVTGKFILSDAANPYNGAEGTMVGDGDGFADPTDNYQNAVWNHLYFYNGLEGEFACSAPAANEGNRCSEDADCDLNGIGGVCNVTSDEKQKIRLGVSDLPHGIPGLGTIAYPADCGPAFHPMGPVTSGGQPIDGDENSALLTPNDCGGFSNGNVLTFSGHNGTVVYTQMKVLENLPIMLTSPDIWEALGLPLTPFEDTVDFFADPGLVNEDSVRPFVAMKAQMHDYDPLAYGGIGSATLDGNGGPVIGFGTAPIDIPNCERCHSNPPNGTMIPNSEAESEVPGEMLMVENSPNEAGTDQYAMVQAEYSFWNAYYGIGTGDSDWYSRLKSAAISMLKGHDDQHGTSFTLKYPGSEVTGELPQNTRLGHESVICQRCHADNVIAAVKSAYCGAGIGDDLGEEQCDQGTLIKPITEAIHTNHRGVSMLDANGVEGPIAFRDSFGRDGSCQGCHPAHRSDGDMAGYPITLAGTNKYRDGDNRGANGGCFVGRDVHSNPGKDSDGAETPEHLNAVGDYLVSEVANNGNGIWCTNCHNQLGQEMWKAENMESLVHGVGLNNVRGQSLQGIADEVAGGDLGKVKAWLDPKDTEMKDYTNAIWAPDPGLCDYVDNELFNNVLPGGIPSKSAFDGNVATIEVHAGGPCSPGYVDGPNLATDFGCNTPATLCGKFDDDGDFSVHIMDFCTTPDCVEAAQLTLTDSLAVPVPMSAATDGRDHWLAPGEPHCADCHAAPYVEQSGNINFYTPFNYPRKASLMRYSRGHQDISCQGCHESIHGLYPVTPSIDTTSYAQAAMLNHDGSHGPLKCGTCHEVDGKGIPTWMSGVKYNGSRIRSYDDAVSWAHTFTNEVSPLETDGVCENCHGDRSGKMRENSGKWLRHSFVGRVGRQIQDKAEIDAFNDVAGGSFVDADDLSGLTSTVCSSCHSLQGGPSGSFANLATCDNTTWKLHNIDGRLAEKVWSYVTATVNDDNDPDTPPETCTW